MKKRALLYDGFEDGKVSCGLCSHRCTIAPDKYGICGIRENEEGVLYTLVYGQAVAASMDPIEKKPLYHFLPGTYSYSIATAGCNFKCGFCQNWQISQVKPADILIHGRNELMPEDIVMEAKARDARSISYTYTEPTVFFEYAYDTSKIAHEAGIRNVFVTNGYMTKETINMIQPYLDAANVDLKFFNDDTYKTVCGARLEPVLDSIRNMKESGIWVEVTTLIVPGLNDSAEEIRNIAGFIYDTDPDMPWHLSRFFPNYEYGDRSPTLISFLDEAYEIAKEAGLKYVYLGNVGSDVNTLCPGCSKKLISRSMFSMHKTLLENGKCSYCQTEIKGVWE